MLLSRAPKFYIDKQIRLIELFAGIGSQAKALEKLRVPFQHYRVCESDGYAVKAYNAIHGTDFSTSDIRDWSSRDLEIVDKKNYCYMLTYSFPCQDLSSIGMGKGMLEGSNTRSSLIWEVRRLLKDLQELPQVLVMENVVQVHSEKNFKEFTKWVSFLKSLGYSNYYSDLNAKNYNCPQDRNRCFMVSILGNFDYTFPRHKPLEKSWIDLLETNVSKEFYLDLKGERPGLRGLHNAEPVLQAIGSRIRPLVWDDYNSMMKNDQSCFGTLTTNCGNKAQRNGYKIIEVNGSFRIPTPLEGFRLMGFEDSDYFKVKDIIPRSKIYQQLGNSICVDVLYEIVRKMLGDFYL